MKISLVVVEGAKQVMLTPEGDHEKSVLEMISPSDDVEIVKKWGSFYDTEKNQHAKLQIDYCKGEYLRAFTSDQSLMFLIKDKKNKKEN
tara:strand:- start:1009 stop:1275 length:267 start_codon:yes stop_codon:yes gene_type:complete